MKPTNKAPSGGLLPVEPLQPKLVVSGDGLASDLAIARETNQRLNRRCQKLERRLNRWESRTYTVAHWRMHLTKWCERERIRADKLEKENQYLRRLKWWRHLFLANDQVQRRPAPKPSTTCDDHGRSL